MQNLRMASQGRVDATRNLILARTGAVALFAILTALAAQVKFWVGSPAPVTMQTMIVVLAGMTLGPVLGAASMLFYLALGFTGYAVFAFGIGPAALVGPTGGYLVGFVVAQPVIGWLSNQRWNPWLRLSLAALAGHAVILTLGAGWLSVLNHGNMQLAWLLGVVPFLPGSALKSGLAVAMARSFQTSRFINPQA